MSPQDQLRALRDDERWESTTLAPRTVRTAESQIPHRRHAVVPVLITALVAVVVIVASIGAIRLGSAHRDRQPAATTSPTQDGATAVIRGTATRTVRTIAGVGRPGGPGAVEVTRLRAIADRVGILTDQPDRSPSRDQRLDSAVHSVLASFGSAVHDLGGTGTAGTGFFLVLNRAPTDEEQQLLRLLPFTVRLSWEIGVSVKERLRLQDAAFASVRAALDASGDTEPETDTQTLSFWPDRDNPRSAQQIAEQMAATITRLSGAPPTFTIRVTDRSKTAEGQAVLHAVDHPLASDGTRLLIGVRPTATSFGVGTGGRYTVNAQRCVALGNAVIIAPPGSSISADGRTIHAKGLGNYRVTDLATAGAEPPLGSREFTAGGGTFIDAKTAASYLPRGSTLCGATQFLLIDR